MSDGEWIDRVRSNRPEDYSSGDLGRLRDEARRSPEVRKALADEIRLDQALHASMGRSPLSTAKIVAHVTAAAMAASAASSAGGSFLGTFFSTAAGWLGVLTVTAAIGVMGLLLVPEPGAGPRGETLSPEKGTILESVTAEQIDPVEDPRYADDGSSPSDKLPGISSSGIAKAGGGGKASVETLPNAAKLPGAKSPPESEEPTRPSRGVTAK